MSLPDAHEPETVSLTKDEPLPPRPRRTLEQHRTDLVSLVAGLVLLAVAVLALLEDVVDLQVRGDVVAPALLLAVGLGGLVVLLRGRREAG